jgi:chemotaxis protein MotB
MQRRTHQSEEAWLLSYADLITNLLIFFAMLLAAAQISKTKMQQITKELSGVEQPASLSAIRKEIEAQIAREGLQEMVRTELTDEGLKVSLDSGIVFDSGSAVIRPEQAPILDKMLQTLVPYTQRYAFAVEGHTDSNPITAGSMYKSNWELSTDRANAVRGRLESVGVAPGRIRVEGYADTVPLPESELVGLTPDQRLARHRRVIVRIF